MFTFLVTHSLRNRLLVLALDLDLFERYPASGPAPSGD